MTQFQYTDDFFGESNAALRPTMQLIHTQNQGIINGVKKFGFYSLLGEGCKYVEAGGHHEGAQALHGG